MITRQRINQARRMIENQHLATSMAVKLPRASAGRNRLVLLALYSNLKANELVSQQSEAHLTNRLSTTDISENFDAKGGR